MLAMPATDVSRHIWAIGSTTGPRDVTAQPCYEITGFCGDNATKAKVKPGRLKAAKDVNHNLIIMSSRNLNGKHRSHFVRVSNIAMVLQAIIRKQIVRAPEWVEVTPVL